MTRFLIMTLAWFAAASAWATEGDFDRPAKNYLAALKKTHTKVFVGSCKTSSGVAIAALPIGRTQGMLFEVEQGSIVNLAPLRLNGHRVSLDIANAQGGIYTYTVMQHHAEDVLGVPFRLLDIGSVEDVLNSPSGGDCPDKAPQ
jgi:hypothetical protein